MRKALLLVFILFVVRSWGQSSSLFLTGPVNYVDVGDLDVAGDQLTVEAIIHYTGASVNIVSKHTNPADVNYLLRIGSFEITTTNGFANFGGVAAAGVNLVQGETYHLAATYNGQFLRYYVNGCLTGEMPWTGDMIQNDLTTAIGQQSSCQCEQFTGFIDEVRIWNVARTQQEIADNMLDLPNPTTTPGLVAYYKFDNDYLNVQGNPVWNGTPVGTPQFDPIPAPLPNSLNLTSLSSDPVCSGGNDGWIASFASGAYLPYEYSIDGINYGVNNEFQNLNAGTYDVFVRPANNSNCVVSEQVILADPLPLNSGLSTADPLCNGGSDGQANVLPSGGHGPDYVVNWSTGDQGNTTTGLSAGNYSVTIADTCVSGGSQLIDNGHFQSYYQGFSTDYGVGAPGPNIGGANLAVTYDASLYHSGFIGTGNGGSGNFMVINGSTTPGQNTWCQTVNVTPNTNYNFSYWLSSLYTVSPGQVQVYFNGVPLGNVETAPATTGVWESHSLFWNSGAASQVQICIEGVNLDNVGNDFGLDDISLKECFSCSVNFPFSIGEPDPLVLNAVTTPENCLGSNDGEILMQVSGGTGAYEYSIDTALTFQASPNFVNLSGGNYAIIVRDQNGCLDTLELVVNTLPSVQFDVSTNDVTCFGGGDGSVEVLNVQNAQGPVEYSIDNGINYQVNTLFSGLGAGNYDVVVQDVNGCQAVLPVLLGEPDELGVSFLTSDVSCANEADGQLSITAAIGGTPGYTYSIDGTNFQPGSIFNNLTSGNYTLTVSDQNSCTLDTLIVINEPDPLISTAVSSPASCYNGNDGEITFSNTQGGTPNYQYSINNGINFGNNPSFQSLSAGIYNVVVEDANGCLFSAIVSVEQPPELEVVIQVDDVLCFGDCNGSLSAQASGGTPGYNYLWAGSNIDQSGAQVLDLCAGNYELTLVDDNGCVLNETVIISQPQPVISNFSTVESEWTILDPTVEFINTSDNATDFEWFFGDGNTSSLINPTHVYSEEDNEYIVTLIASNENGCADTVSSRIRIENEILYYIPNTFTPDGNVHNETFQVVFFSGFEPTDYDFLIFNRWGEIVFKSSNPAEMWDGTYQGKPVKEGTYIWKLEFRETVTDERYIDTGHLNVIR